MKICLPGSFSVYILMRRKYASTEILNYIDVVAVHVVGAAQK
jgi:hypothetical protein